MCKKVYFYKQNNTAAIITAVLLLYLKNIYTEKIIGETE